MLWIRHNLYGSGSFHHQAKIAREPSISLWFLSLKNYVYVPLKCNKQLNFSLRCNRKAICTESQPKFDHFASFLLEWTTFPTAVSRTPTFLVKQIPSHRKRDPKAGGYLPYGNNGTVPKSASSRTFIENPYRSSAHFTFVCLCFGRFVGTYSWL